MKYATYTSIEYQYDESPVSVIGYIIPWLYGSLYQNYMAWLPVVNIVAKQQIC